MLNLITVRAGDSYLSVHGNADRLDIGATPDLTNAVVRWRARHRATYAETPAIDCSVAGAGTDDQVVTIELDDSLTAGLIVGEEGYTWQIEATWSGGDPGTIAHGVMTVLKNLF